MKRVLLVSFHFPPDAEVGAIRPAEFAKNLPRYGWLPHVLTVKEKHYIRVDPERFANLGGISITRTGKLPNVNELYMTIKGTLKIGGAASSAKERIQLESPSNNGVNPAFYRLRRYYNSLLVYLPDKDVGWVMPAVLKGLEIIRNHRIDAIFTTSPPHSVHLIGMLLKDISRIPWIADFRDPWMTQMKPDRSRTWLSDYIEHSLERKVVTKADRVVSVTSEMTHRLNTTYGNSAKFVTIPNGFDKKFLSRFSGSTKYDKFTITYIGSLYFGRNPFTLLKAISNAIRKEHIPVSNLQVRMVGDCRTSDGKSVEKMVDELDLREIVKFVDHVPQEKALEEIARSHVVLLLAPSQPFQIPGKVYEYIGMNASILALCGEGATRSLLESYPKASTVAPDDLEGIEASIIRLYRKKTEVVVEDGFPYSDFERSSLTAKLAAIMQHPNVDSSCNCLTVR